MKRRPLPLAGAANAAVVALAALGLRLPFLSQRPMHVDEAVHAVKCEELRATGRYVYDPREYHGPTLYYATLPLFWLLGIGDSPQASEATYRLVPVLFGVGLILLLPLVADGLGRFATLVAAVLCAVSPAMVFYSRYYIQETLLVFFTFLAIAAGWRWVRSRRIAWALLAGAAVGLMHATKETSIIALGCMTVATVVAWAGGAWIGGARLQTAEALGWESGRTPVPQNPKTGGCPMPQGETTDWKPVSSGPDAPVRAITGGALVAAAVSMTLYSALFTHARGPVDSITTFATYFDRAGGRGLHDHPWNYYLRLLLYTQFGRSPVWSEALIVALAAVGLGAAAVSLTAARRGGRAADPSRRGGGDAPAAPKEARDEFERSGAGRRSEPAAKAIGADMGNARFLSFLAVYTLLMALLYSAIPYKTPWCMLGFLHGMILLAGVGTAALMRWSPTHRLRLVAGAVLAAGVAHLGWQSWLGVTLFAPGHTDEYVRSNPYVYSHTSRDLRKLVALVDELAAAGPAGRDVLIHVYAENSWPLPWYLRGYSQVGYWELPPAAPPGPIVIVSTALIERLDAAVGERYVDNNTFCLRPDEFLGVYVEPGLWQSMLRGRAR